MWFPVVAALVGTATAILADILASRLGARRTSAYATSLVLGFVATLIALLFVAFTIDDWDFSGLLITVLLYGAWWFAALNFIQSFDSSLRVRLLILIDQAGGRLSRAELYRQYNDQVLLNLRLARLTQQGYVIEREGRLFVSSSQLRFVAQFFRALKIALIGRRSEFVRPAASP